MSTFDAFLWVLINHHLCFTLTNVFQYVVAEPPEEDLPLRVHSELELRKQLKSKPKLVQDLVRTTVVIWM